MNGKPLFILALAVIAIAIITTLVIRQPRETTDLAGNPVDDPRKFFEESKRVESKGGTHDFFKDNAGNSNPETRQSSQEMPAVLITNGTKHTVPLEDIQSGGPPKDGIPSIDRPSFISVSEADKLLSDDGLGIAVSLSGTSRFYPNQILVWHEIVNDTIQGKRILVTYCPLCGTGIVFDPLVKGERVEFGTSGKLWNSNLIMYDRRTETYWSQVLGSAIVGELAGEKLSLIPYKNLTYADWKRVNPNGEVLSSDTGFPRNYNSDPYGDYYDISNPSIYFPIDNRSDAYPEKAIVYGIEIEGTFKAYAESELKKIETAEDTLAGVPMKITYDAETNTATFVDIRTDTEIVPVFGFWFSWYSVHPDTLLFKAP